MRRVALALALFAGYLLGSATPASAHNYDTYSLWSCAWTRPTEHFSIEHSHPVAITTSYVDYGCLGLRSDGIVQCHWFATYWFIFEPVRITGHDYSPCEVVG